MIEKLTKDIYFISRLFVLLSLSLLILPNYKETNLLQISILGIYALNNVYIYIFPVPKIFKKMSVIFDVILIPLYVFLSGNFFNVYPLAILISLYSTRKIFYGIFLTALAVALSIYYFYNSPILFSANSLFFLGILFSSYNFETLYSLGKERKRILKLKKDYHKLLKEFSNYEKERRMFKNLKLVFKYLRESKEPKEYLLKVKNTFNVKKVKVIPVNEIDNEVRKDFEKGILSVNLKLEKGYAKVIYELNSPFQLRDEVLVYTLTEAARLLSIVVEGFEEGKEKAKSLTVS